MRKTTILLGCILLAVIGIAGCGTAKPDLKSENNIELNVSAAVSLKDALEEIKKEYEKKHPHVKIIYNLGASGSLQRQIEQGAPADLFISAAPKQMDELERKHLISKGSRINLVENQLVLVTPKTSAFVLKDFSDIQQAAVKKIALGETAVVPAGQYAQQALASMGLWETAKEKAVYAKDVRTVLTYVETGNVEAGFVYKTDAAASEKVQIAAIAPAGSHAPIVSPMGMMEGAKNHKAAEAFALYLTGAEGKAVFEKYGFVTGK